MRGGPGGLGSHSSMVCQDGGDMFGIVIYCNGPVSEAAVYGRSTHCQVQ